MHVLRLRIYYTTEKFYHVDLRIAISVQLNLLTQLLWRCHNKFIIDTITNAAAATDGDDDDDKDGGVYRY